MIYLDNAATTKISEEVLQAMAPYLQEEYGNPSGVYALARSARGAMDSAREQIRAALKAEYAKEIIFTGSGTEADNLAIKGVARANKKRGHHIITSQIEHHAVLNTCKQLEEEGFAVTYLKPDKEGRISPEDVAAAITDQTILISIMWANNEVGTINQIRHIGEIARANHIYFHTDAVQAVGHLDIDVQRDNVDLLSLSAHKFHGPKGVGALYVKEGVFIEPIIQGGSQERRMRAGTESVASIVGMGTALEAACKNNVREAIYIAKLRDSLLTYIRIFMPEVVVNGALYHRLPGNLSLSFPGYLASDILFALDEAEVMCSGGAACTAASEGPSHVLRAMGILPNIAEGTIRFSFSKYTTMEEITRTAQILQNILAK